MAALEDVTMQVHYIIMTHHSIIVQCANGEIGKKIIRIDILPFILSRCRRLWRFYRGRFFHRHFTKDVSPFGCSSLCISSMIGPACSVSALVCSACGVVPVKSCVQARLKRITFSQYTQPHTYRRRTCDWHRPPVSSARMYTLLSSD